MVEIPPYGWAAEHDPILTRITEAVTDAIVTLAANLPTDTNLADVRARLLAVETALSDLPEGYDDAPIRQELAAVQQALGDAASADALASALQQLATLETTVGNIAVVPYDDAPLVAAINAQGQRLAAAEALLADLPEGVDLTPIQTEIAQLKARLDNIDGAPVNRPPTSSPIPTQMLTVGTPFSFSAAGYYSDPDNHPLSALDVTGTLPPGIVQSGFDFTGTPTATGNYTVTLIVEDLYGEQTSRSIAWTVQAVSVPGISVESEPAGYTLQNPGTIPQTNPVPAVGGYTLEIV